MFPSPEEVSEAFLEISRTGIYANGGPAERRFAAALAEWVGAPAACVSVVSSGTAALVLALQACFRSDRRYALIPSFTHPAGPQVVDACGYEPVFFDLHGDGWQPSLSQAARFLDSRGAETAGILLTNTFGTANPEIEGWEQLAGRHQLPLVIDSAAGFGSEYPWGERLGLRGTCEIFSFHATKTLAVGEGGAVVSRDARLIDEVQRRKSFGYEFTSGALEPGAISGPARVCLGPGTNANLAELGAAIGTLQVAAMAPRLERRRDVQRRYEAALAPLGIGFQSLAGCSALPFVSALLPTREARDGAVLSLRAAGVRCHVYYSPPVHRHPYFSARERAGELRSTEAVAGRILSLPMADELSQEEIDYIAGCIEQALDRDLREALS